MRAAPGKPAVDASAKGDFANRAWGIAKRASHLPAVPVLPVIAVAVAILASIAGAFGTHSLTAPQRFGFWFILMAIEAVKWLSWLGWKVKTPEDYWRASLIGTPLLSLLLPAEIWLSLWVVGAAGVFLFSPVLLVAAAVGVVVLAVMAAIHPPQWLQRDVAVEPGVLKKSGVSPSGVLAVSAEDHYCTLHLDEGREVLVSARLSDVLAELDAADGARIHRSHWIADAGVRAARRAGRGWELVLPNGTALRVSATYREEAKRRGWLSRRG